MTKSKVFLKYLLKEKPRDRAREEVQCFHLRLLGPMILFLLGKSQGATVPRNTSVNTDVGL